MKEPKYTDLHKYPNGYKKSTHTDIKRTFNRIRAEQAKNEAEKDEKVRELKKVKSVDKPNRSTIDREEKYEESKWK